MELLRPLRLRKRLPVCEKCKVKMPQTLAPFTLKLWPPPSGPKGPNGGLFLEHVSHEGKEFRNEGDLRRYCREAGIESNALL